MSKADFLAALAFREERVEVPGFSFLLREFNGAQRDAYESGMVVVVDGKREADLTNMRAKLVAPSIAGEPWTVDEVALLPSSVLEPLWQAAQRVNGMGAAALDTAVKNSESGPSAASTSDSPSL